MCFLHLFQLWKNETVAEQEKHSPKEKPILLSKDIEYKLALLDREVNYLLNKAKFTKPKAKAKNSTSTNKSSKPNNKTEEKDPLHTQESTDSNNGTSTFYSWLGVGSAGFMWVGYLWLVCACPKVENPEPVQPGDSPPTEDSTLQADSDDQSQPTEGTVKTGQSVLLLSCHSK